MRKLTLWTLVCASLGATFMLTGCGGGSSAATNPNPSTPTSTQHVFDGTCDEMGNPFGGGDGSQSSPYQICTATQLSNVAQTAYASSSFLLVDNIDMNNTPVLQVPNFQGVFDGNDKAINNWNGDAPLFTNLTGTVKNLNIQNANVTGSYRVSLIAGTVTSTGAITNCHVVGTINASYDVGGIAGFNAGHISNCSANVTVVGTDHLAGLVGMNTGTVTSCTATGSVAGSTGMLDDGIDGGLVALNDGGTITLSSSSVNVSGQNGVGGLVGFDDHGTITQCSSSGTVRGNVGVGGFVGDTYLSNITNAFSIATVIGASAAGGFVGQNGSNISFAYATGAVSGSSSGGFAGSASYVYQPPGNPAPSPTTYNGTITSSYWDTQASGMSTSAGGSGVVGESTAAMESEGTYSGWNFTSLWNSPTGGYPTLR